VTLHQYGIYLSEVSKISHFQVLTMGVFFAVNYSSLKPRILLLSGICGSGRSHWLVDIPLPEEGGYSLSPFEQRSTAWFQKRLEVCIPFPCGEHALEICMFLGTVQLDRLTLQGSALTFQV